MLTTKTIAFGCPACGVQSSAPVTTIIDPSENPEAKSQLLAGQLNVVQCPNCGTRSTASTPLLYHDADNELLITFVPMQLDMDDKEADRVIGVLMNEITKSLEGKMIKGYIFQPGRALTMQGLIEQVLEADGVTPEMMSEQKERSRLVQTFLQTDPASYAALVTEHDDKLDMQFFQTMSLIAQRYMQEGRVELAEQVLTVQQQIAELSTVGKELIKQTEEQDAMVREVAEKLQQMGTRPTPADVVNLVRPYAEDDARLQAFVGLARPIFDYPFFQELTKVIEETPEVERAPLENLRNALAEYTQAVDQQAQMQMQAAANVLRQILQSPDPQAAIAANLQLIDDNFMTVLEMNIQEAEKQQDIAASAKLKSIRDTVMAALQQAMNPEMLLINDLLSAESEAAARQILTERGAQYGEQLLEMFDAISEVMSAQGQMQVVERLTLLRGMAQEVVAGS
ncbi:MAG: CpXC domain-containing protein [Chloroflexota bacterium]